LNSYSLYADVLRESYDRMATPEFMKDAAAAMQLLEKEAELEEIVRLVGKDTLSAQDRLVLEVARSIREDFLHQNAFHEVDTYASLAKQAAMLRAILHFHELGKAALARGVDMEAIERAAVRDRIARMKYLTEAEAPAAIAQTSTEMEKELAALEAA
jgi:V/A-type H+-transporting ATPase subunit A